MKKLLSLFVILSIMLTNSSIAVACSSADTPREYGVFYNFTRVSGEDWSMNDDYDIPFSSGVPGNFYTAENDNISISAVTTLGIVVYLIKHLEWGRKNSVSLSNPDFKIVFNEYDFQIIKNLANTSEFKIMLI